MYNLTVEVGMGKLPHPNYKQAVKWTEPLSEADFLGQNGQTT